MKKADLAKWITESQEAGTITDDLYQAIVKLVNGVNQRYTIEGLEDTIQDVCIAVLTNLNKFDPEKNLFAYLSTLVRNASNRRYRERCRDEGFLYKFWNHKNN